MMRWPEAGFVGLLAAIVLLSPAGADSVADFYRGKTVSLIMSVGEGDGMDKAARIIAKHWTKHIPGNPNIVVKNMPGAGALRATNFLHNQAPKDGTTLAGLIPSFVRHQMVGGTGVDYDSAAFQWIGSSNTSNTTVFVWAASGITSIDDARKREVLMGSTGTGSNSAHYPTILNNVLGTRFKIIMGYRGTPVINIAIERGELQGRAGETFNTLMLNHAAWVKENKINILTQIGLRKEAGFEHIPLLTEFAKDADTRAVLQVFCDEIALGRPYLAPPGTPVDRVAALRASFAATMQDPAFLADAKQIRLDVLHTPGEELQKIAAGLVRTRSDVLARAKDALKLGAIGKVSGDGK